MNFSVMTLNLRFNNPDDGENAWLYRKDKVSAFLQSNLPLIIGTQEGFPSMLADLQRNSPGYNKIGDSRSKNAEDEHNVIFYKTEEIKITDHGQFWLSETPEEIGSISWDSSLPRICTWGVFRFIKDPSYQFVVYNTHLDHAGQKAREKGARIILDKMRRHVNQNLPIILTGDMNADPKNKAIQILNGNFLKDVYTKLTYSPGGTFHGFQGGLDGQTIDYIFTSSNVRVSKINIDRNVDDGDYISDHYPVMAQLEI